jgi:NAD(P)-dependent dehydrogenase (short-subunit alcohol dehydrogenase family)
MNEGVCEGRVCIVTGAGRGIGREYARALAQHGARLVVNDFGGAVDGSGRASAPAHEVVDEIAAAGGEAIAHVGDASSLAESTAMVQLALDTFGQLDVVINNAGILRDRMLFSMTEDEWDAVIRVHLRGTWAPSRVAAEHWRNRAKAGLTNDARLINTTSVSGIYGSPGQSNYGAAKAGIAAFTQIAADELGRYGVTANAIAPIALTRMTEGLRDYPADDRRLLDPRWVAPVVVWLASPLSADVTGQVIESSGRMLGIAEGWHRGPHVTDPPTEPAQVDAVIRTLLPQARARTRNNG